jgi:trk system potassium uptake protein TrkA
MFVVIIGGGKVGAHLASLLLEASHTVKVIEINRERCLELQKTFKADAIVLGNGADPAVLEAADVRQASAVAAVTGKDEINLVATSLSRFEFNVRRTIARVNHPANTWMFTPKMGVDVALNQADVMSHLILEELSLGDMQLLLKLRRGQYALVEEKVDPKALAVGKAIKTLELPANCRWVAVLRQGHLLMPDGDLVLQPIDEVLAIVHNTQLNTLAALLGAPK